MITIYKNKRDIPREQQYIEWNDLFFNRYTAARLDERAVKIVKKIDGSNLLSKYTIESKFHKGVLDVDRLSTGCKTVLNVMYFPDNVFCIKECGNNALEVLYGLERGYVYSDYAVIPFQMNRVLACTKKEKKVIGNYEDLKEWWEDEK